MLIAGWVVSVIGVLLTVWAAAGVFDKHSRSDDDVPFMAFAIVVTVIGLVLLGYGIGP